MYKIGDVFYDDNEYSKRAEFCNNNNLIIKEIESDNKGRRFTIINAPALTPKEKLISEINNKKLLLEKYKEDVEQVKLFGIIREDFESKKALCANLILELKELESKLN